MRAREFIFENNIVKNRFKPKKHNERAMPSAHRVAGTADRHYDLNRIMMTVAGSDHNGVGHVPDVQSWAGKNNIATPYTLAELEMLKHAYRAMGAEWDDVLKPNPKQLSLEDDAVNKVSPVKVGKKNRYGV